MILSLIQHWLQAGNAHHIHSPFVYHLYTEIIRSQQYYYAYEEVENLHRALRKDTRVIQVQDYGAGSKRLPGRHRRIGAIARHSVLSRKEGRLLFRLVNHFQPKVIFELGTSLGISTAYLGKAGGQSQIYTFEGCPATAHIARENFSHLKLAQIQVLVGSLENTLLNQVQKVDQIDFLYMDANHRYEPTLAYFETCLPKLHENSLVILDDIYWSKEMQVAWQNLHHRPEVGLSIDLFQMGLLFFRKKQAKEHFTLHF